MKSWSWKSQPIKPNSTSELVEPKFLQYKSNYQTQYGNSCINLCPYGDLLPPYQLEYGAEGFCFLGRPWNENELNDQFYEKLQQLYGEYESYFAYENLQPPYGGGASADSGGSGSNWVSEYEAYFVGGWGDDIFSHGYGSLGEERGLCGDDKVEGDFCWGGEKGDIYYSYDWDMEMEYPYYDDSCWFGFWEDEGFNGYDGLHENEDSLYGLNGLDEMGLCESIFGHWPCLEQGFA